MPGGRTFLNHVAVTVAASPLDAARTEICTVYGEVFGWREIEYLAREDRLSLVIDRSSRHYLNIRSRPDPMITSGYEHLGVVVDDEAEFDACWARAHEAERRFDGVVLRPARKGTGGTRTFRFRFRLPLAVEIMWFPPSPS